GITTRKSSTKRRYATNRKGGLNVRLSLKHFDGCRRGRKMAGETSQEGPGRKPSWGFADCTPIRQVSGGRPGLITEALPRNVRLPTSVRPSATQPLWKVSAPIEAISATKLSEPSTRRSGSIWETVETSERGPMRAPKARSHGIA